MLSAEPKTEADNTLTETLTKWDVTKTESNNCFIIHCFEENNDKRTVAKDPEMILLLEIMHCERNLQIGQLSATNLKVALISKINCRLLANDKTGNEYNV